MGPINVDELMLAIKWLRTQPRQVQLGIHRATRSVDKCRVDGTWVLIASYRCHTRMMADTVPAKKGGKV